MYEVKFGEVTENGCFCVIPSFSGLFVNLIVVSGVLSFLSLLFITSANTSFKRFLNCKVLENLYTSPLYL
ncbi:unnamed protein product [Periconia digitata]|uniref:Uncharacterized protein n=1 Tax=Periconia digitata TaxID=1303443 RepID=A0A9W4UAM0_9PLEO|nr:unnamed protein product [Periconia digitata]